ncbi:unnamed protein product [Absidia cylindrospora]
MAQSPLKKKRVHGNISNRKSTSPQASSSSSSNTLAANINCNQDDTNYSDNDIENFCDMDDYSNTMRKSDQLILPKQTFIDIDSLENDSEGQANNDYELIDTDDDFHQPPFSDHDNSKPNDKKKDSKKKGKATLSLSLSAYTPSLPKKPKLLEGSTPAFRKRRLEDSDDNDDHNDDSNKDKTTNGSNGSNKKHTRHEAIPPPATAAAAAVAPVNDDHHLPPIQESMLEDDTNATPRRRESLDKRWDPGSKYEVESILQHKIYRNHVIRYEVKWKGYPDSENTFEPATSFHEDCRAFVLQYWRSLPKDVVRPANIPVDPTLNDDNENGVTSLALTTTTTKSPLTSAAATGGGKIMKDGLPNEVISLDDDDENDWDDMAMDYCHQPISRMLGSDDDMALGSDNNNNNSSSDSDNRTELGLNKDTPTATTEAIATAAAAISTNGPSNNTKTIIPIINDDTYKCIARNKKITQRDMATNYKKDGYKFIYSKSAGQILDEMDWTDDEMTIDNILPLKTDPTQLMAYLTWPNNIKTVHLIEELHDKCAKKLCLYYEKRIRYAHSS